MIGEQTVEALVARATTFGARATHEEPAAVLPEARTAAADMRVELERDIFAAGQAWGNGPAGASLEETLARQAPFTAEMEGDRAAIAQMSRVVQGLNQRVDRAGYAATEARVTAITNQSVALDEATALAALRDTAGAVGLHRIYLAALGVTDTQAVTLTAATAGTRADPESVLADFRNLRRRLDMTQQRAALLTATGDIEAAYTRFKAFRDSGQDADVAALLAEPLGSATAQQVYDRLLAGGDITALGAATIAAAAARTGVGADRAVATYRELREDNSRTTAPVLAAAAIASGKTADQVGAARAYFAERGKIDADVAAAAWAMDGSTGPAMASIVTLLFQPV